MGLRFCVFQYFFHLRKLTHENRREKTSSDDMSALSRTLARKLFELETKIKMIFKAFFMLFNYVHKLFSLKLIVFMQIDSISFLA